MTMHWMNQFTLGILVVTFWVQYLTSIVLKSSSVFPIVMLCVTGFVFCVNGVLIWMAYRAK